MTNLVLRLLAGLSLSTLLVAFVDAGEDTPEPLDSDPKFEATLIDGSVIHGRIRSIREDGQIVLFDDQRTDIVVGAAQLVKLSRMVRTPSLTIPNEPMLVLVGIDQLRGQIDSADETSVQLRSTILGEMVIPLEVVLGFSVIADRNERLEEKTIRQLRTSDRSSDRLYLINGDERDITFSALTDLQVDYLDADRSQKLPREVVRGIGLDPGLVQEPENLGPTFDLILTDRSRIRVVGLDIQQGRLIARTTFGAEVEVPLDRVEDCFLLGASVVYLSDIEAAREVTVPYVGPSRSSKSNQSVLGQPISVGGRRYSRGLGTQSRSLLAYRLGERDRRFQALVAIDDVAGPLGNVLFRVLVDGEERYASSMVASGDSPIAVDVDVSGGQFLILATEFGQGGGVRDYAAWIEARVIREASPVPPGTSGPSINGN